MPSADIKAKLIAGGLPHAANATKPTADATVARLTDTSKYTGIWLWLKFVCFFNCANI